MKSPRRLILIAAGVAILACIGLIGLSPILNSSPERQATLTARADERTAEAVLEAELGATEAARPTGTPPPSETPSPTETARPSDTPVATDTPVPLPTPITLSGAGDSVIDVATSGDASIVHFTHGGQGNFIVNNYGADSQLYGLLVNVIGPYDGTVGLDFEDGQQTARFEITASGTWTIEIRSLLEARTFEAPGTLSGKGDDVVLVGGEVDTAAVTHEGAANFIVYGYSPGGVNLLINEIGPYSGTVLLPAGLFVLEVRADGNWTFEISAP